MKATNPRKSTLTYSITSYVVRAPTVAHTAIATATATATPSLPVVRYGSSSYYCRG